MKYTGLPSFHLSEGPLSPYGEARWRTQPATGKRLYALEDVVQARLLTEAAARMLVSPSALSQFQPRA